MADNDQHRVVILGGGFGGVFTAKHLRRLAGANVQVELISRDNFFVFQPLLAEVAGGSIQPADAVSPLRSPWTGGIARRPQIRREHGLLGWAISLYFNGLEHDCFTP